MKIAGYFDMSMLTKTVVFWSQLQTENHIYVSSVNSLSHVLSRHCESILCCVCSYLACIALRMMIHSVTVLLSMIIEWTECVSSGSSIPLSKAYRPFWRQRLLRIYLHLLNKPNSAEKQQKYAKKQNNKIHKDMKN